MLRRLLLWFDNATPGFQFTALLVVFGSAIGAVIAYVVTL